MNTKIMMVTSSTVINTFIIVKCYKNIFLKKKEKKKKNPTAEV